MTYLLFFFFKAQNILICNIKEIFSHLNNAKIEYNCLLDIIRLLRMTIFTEMTFKLGLLQDYTIILGELSIEENLYFCSPYRYSRQIRANQYNTITSCANW